MSIVLLYVHGSEGETTDAWMRPLKAGFLAAAFHEANLVEVGLLAFFPFPPDIRDRRYTLRPRRHYLHVITLMIVGIFEVAPCGVVIVPYLYC